MGRLSGVVWYVWEQARIDDQVFDLCGDWMRKYEKAGFEIASGGLWIRNGEGYKESRLNAGKRAGH